MIPLSIPRTSPADKGRIEALVQQCLIAQGQAIAPYEAEIGAIVARLYGLTAAEPKIIERKEG